MTTSSWLQIGLYFAVLLALVEPLGAYMARVYQRQSTPLDRVLGPLERLCYRALGISADQEMDWSAYAIAVVLFSLAGMLILYTVQRLQSWLPLDPRGFPGVSPDLAFNRAAVMVQCQMETPPVPLSYCHNW